MLKGVDMAEAPTVTTAIENAIGCLELAKDYIEEGDYSMAGISLMGANLHEMNAMEVIKRRTEPDE
jgi:hypothetical protein